MNSETRNCQNCKQPFLIEPADFDFYKKMQVPPPTFCPLCRFQRRLMFQNQRVFYKRSCALCGQSVVTIYAPDRPRVVYCQRCWWSDQWDPLDFGVEYDPSRIFFEQLAELTEKTPFSALSTGYSTLVNSDYVNEAAYAKNCYLIFNADYNENVMYGAHVDHNKDAMDANLLESSELCYELINCEKCFKVFFSEDCVSCTNVYFSKNLSGCSDCFGCVNLRNKRYHIWNEPHTKEEYERKLAELATDSFAAIEALREKAYAFWRKYPHKMLQGIHNVDVSGDYIYESKNAHDMYQVRSVENGRFCQSITLAPAKDIYDLTQWGAGAQRIYDTWGSGEGADMIRFCYGSWSQAANNEYSMFAVSSSNVFGCANIRKRQYCILNRQYSPEEYNALREKIVADMERHPYVDSAGRTWKYGEFFPYDLSPFDYNESMAIQLFPMTEEGALKNGWRWRQPTASAHQPTLTAEELPDSITATQDSITSEILGCASCKKPYRIIPAELELLRRFGLPIPRSCADCRHMARTRRTNPPQLWSRQCAKCAEAIQTSYAPDRPEIVYCENCYQQEVI